MADTLHLQQTLEMNLFSPETLSLRLFPRGNDWIHPVGASVQLLRSSIHCDNNIAKKVFPTLERGGDSEEGPRVSHIPA